jgi:hypothetical protein
VQLAEGARQPTLYKRTFLLQLDCARGSDLSQ